MLGKVDNVNFTSRIVKNQIFHEGLKSAKKDTETPNGQMRTNEFINALRYIENDGQNDYYSVELIGEGHGNCKLLKNGVTINTMHANSNGFSVTRVFSDYVKNNLKIDITSKPAVPSMIYRDSLSKAHSRLDKVQNEINKSREELNQLDKEVITPKIKEDLDNAVNEFCIVI